MKVNWKGRFKFVKSLRFRILVILIIIGIVPSIIVEKGIRKQLRGSGSLEPAAECKEPV